MSKKNRNKQSSQQQSSQNSYNPQAVPEQQQNTQDCNNGRSGNSSK